MKSLMVLVLIVFSAFFAACGVDASRTFSAIVLENDSVLMVRPDDDTMEIKSSDKIVVHNRKAAIRNSSGEVITLDEIKKGAWVEIRYDGKIAESYPAQITAYEIKLLD